MTITLQRRSAQREIIIQLDTASPGINANAVAPSAPEVKLDVCSPLAFKPRRAPVYALDMQKKNQVFNGRKAAVLAELRKCTAGVPSLPLSALAQVNDDNDLECGNVRNHAHVEDRQDLLGTTNVRDDEVTDTSMATTRAENNSAELAPDSNIARAAISIENGKFLIADEVVADKPDMSPGTMRRFKESQVKILNNEGRKKYQLGYQLAEKSELRPGERAPMPVPFIAPVPAQAPSIFELFPEIAPASVPGSSPYHPK